MRNQKLCPFRTETIIYHNDKKSYMVPQYGINKRVDYDVMNVSFQLCMEDDCMLYNPISKTCMYSKKI